MHNENKGIVEDIYEFEIEIEASSTDEAIKKLKELRNSNSVDGVFVADACTYKKSDFSLRK